MSQFINRIIGDGIYQISSDEYGHSYEFGKANANSYLIIGNKKAALIDLAVKLDHIQDYVQTITDKELIVILTHAHPDHIYFMNRFEEIYLHQNDRNFPLCFLPFWKKKPRMNFINEKSQIDLGGRTLSIIPVAGHTNGSILISDNKTGFLFSGDTIARRLLYGLTGAPTMDEFINSLKNVREMNPKAIYSCHDRADLQKEYIDFMIDEIQTKLPYCQKTWQVPPFPKMMNLVDGKEEEHFFCDIAVDRKKIKRN